MAKKFKKPAPFSKKPASGAKPPPVDPKQPVPKQQAPAQTATGTDQEHSNDQLIANVQDRVRNSIPAQFRVAVQKIVLAGTKIMYDPQTHHLMVQAIQSDNDPAHAVGMGVTQLVTLMYQQSKGSMPAPAIIPAAILLVCEALDFCEQAKLFPVDNDVVSNAVQVTVAYLMQKMGLTPEKVSALAQQAAGKGGGQPPAPDAGAAPAPAPAPAAPGGGGLVQQQMGA